MQIGRILRGCAVTFVIIGWLLFLISIPICFSVIVGTAINLTYFAASPRIPFDAFDNHASWIFLAAVAFASVASSIALAIRFRATATALVIVTWTMTIAGILVARSFVIPGPEYFERHVGHDVFLVPWEYVPTAPGVPLSKMPNEVGLAARLCLSNPGVRTDAGCSPNQVVHFFPTENSGTDRDLESWRKYQSRMSPGLDRSGYKSFELRETLSSGRVVVQRYFARLTPNGQLTRLIICRGNSETFCTTHALADKYWIKYPAGLAEGDEVLDGKLAAVMESWRQK